MACADETGTYDLTAWAAGTYVMLFTDPSCRFAAEYSGGAATLSQAKPVHVVAGSTATASAALDIGAVLKGRVVNAVSGEGIPDVCPGAYSGRTGPYVPGQAPTCSNEVGALTSSAASRPLRRQWRCLPGGTPAWRSPGTSAPLTSRAPPFFGPKVGRVTTLQDVRLEPGGTVTGVVTDGLGNPVPDVHVNLMGSYGGRSGGCESPVCGYTDENGRYTVMAPAGTYTPFFWSYNGGWAPEWSGDATTRATAAPVTVTSGSETVLDAVLDQGGQVTGTVVAADGSQPTQYALGLVFTKAGEYIGDFDAFDATEWTFRNSPLPGWEASASRCCPTTRPVARRRAAGTQRPR